MQVETEKSINRFSGKSVVVICIALFALAFAVRVLTWQNNKIEMAGVQYVLTQIYTADAKTLLSGGIGLFLAGPNPPSDASVLLHPPGFPIFIAAIYGVFGETDAYRIIQILLNSLAPIIIFFIARRLFDARTAAIAGFLVAFAPQFAYHSALFLPDEIAVLPLLAAVYFLIRTVQEKCLPMAVCCGVSLGLSCWFRSNALLMPVFFALGFLLLLPRQICLKFAAALVASFVLVIAPITIRNYIVFDSLVPLSLGMGTTFVEGLGDYDTEGGLGMPSTDEGVMEMDARLAGRPDYYGRLYSPDGVKRDRERIKAGLAVVAVNPVWYAASVVTRGFSTLRLERVPSISPDRDERSTTNPILYYPNVPLKLFQRLFITAVFLPMAIFGILLLLRKKEQRSKILILALVPLYYMSVQALIHTEYRYVLATPHILMIFAAVSLSYLIEKLIPLKPRPS